VPFEVRKDDIAVGPVKNVGHLYGRKVAIIGLQVHNGATIHSVGDDDGTSQKALRIAVLRRRLQGIFSLPPPPGVQNRRIEEERESACRFNPQGNLPGIVGWEKTTVLPFAPVKLDAHPVSPAEGGLHFLQQTAQFAHVWAVGA
jgi:hypothetical protein